MENTAVDERRPKRDETRFFVKSDRMLLSEEHGAIESALASLLHQSREHLRTKSAATDIRANGHPADLSGPLTRIIKTPGRNRPAIQVAHEHVNGGTVGNVVDVDLFFLGNLLFAHEHIDADVDRFVHASAIGGREDFQSHRTARCAAGERGPCLVANTVNWKRVHLTTGILERDGAILLVASRYPGRPEPLWNLPGGRQDGHELHAAALVREFREETGLAIAVGRLAYVAESFDPHVDMQFTNVAFHVHSSGEPSVQADDTHAVDYAWVPRAQLATVLSVAVVREPLLRYLDDATQQYFGFDDAGLTVRLFD